MRTPGENPRWITVAAVTATALVLGAAIAQAVRERSVAPLVTVGWVPAVLIAVLSPRSARGCRRRARRAPRP